MLKYEDLLTVPYLENGRTLEGMDCYGSCIILAERTGKKLNDILKGECPNVRKVDKAEKYGLVETDDGMLHLGFLIEKDLVFNMTESGARLIPLAFMNVHALYVIY